MVVYITELRRNQNFVHLLHIFIRRRRRRPRSRLLMRFHSVLPVLSVSA